MYLGIYLSKIRGLMNLKRYQNLFLHKQRSVAEHSWSVAKISQALALLEMEKFGNKVDMGLLLQKAICHDELELITGDILSHTKRRTPAMTHAVDELEEVIYEEEYGMKIIPKNWVEPFRKFTLEAKDNTIEGKILGAADVIDTILESADEIKLGNLEYFTDVLRSSAEKLLKIDLDSVRYFIKHSLTDFGLDIREYYGFNVYQAIQEMKMNDGDDVSYIHYENVLELYKTGTDEEWVVQHDDQRNEIMRFRNASPGVIEVVKNGSVKIIQKDQFNIYTSDLLCGNWFILREKKIA